MVFLVFKHPSHCFDIVWLYLFVHFWMGFIISLKNILYNPVIYDSGNMGDTKHTVRMPAS